jgi:RimJ/RimL family protein N-acetyltransferase
MEPFQTITTERLLIRKLGPGDTAAFFAYRSLPEVYKYQAFRPVKISEAEDLIGKMPEFPNLPNTWFQLAVCRLVDGQFTGDIGLHFLEDNAQVEIGYTIAPEFQGQGYAHEALIAVTDYLFQKLKKHRIFASGDPNNIKSVVLLNKIGMRKEAHFVKSIRIDNRWVDDCVYALLDEEWRRG